MLINRLQIINTYTEAVQTVDPMKATGKPHSLWVSFAKFYEENEQLDDVRQEHFYCRTFQASALARNIQLLLCQPGSDHF